MDWFVRDFDHPLYFRIYQSKAREAELEGPALAALLKLPTQNLVLDLPCGWGRLQPGLQAHGLQVIGGDLSMLNLKRHAEEHPAPLVRLDLRSLPFRDECAPGVFCAFTSWGYFATDLENLMQLREFARILQPQGVLLLDLIGRDYLEQAVRPLENTWFRTEEGYRERVRWSPDHRRVLTDRMMEGERFRHDIWIPDHSEVLDYLAQAGFRLEAAFGGLNGEPWQRDAERWIYRAIKI